MNNFEKKTEKDLQKLLAEKRESLRNLRFKSSGSKNKNVKETMGVKKEVAQVLTELRRREIEEIKK